MGLLSNLFPSFKEQDIVFLENAVFDEEIKKALFDMAPLKVPGSNRFHAYFFQSQWDIVGNVVDDSNLGTYLGVLLLHERVTKSTLSYVVENVRRKLQNWENNSFLLKIGWMMLYGFEFSALNKDCTLKDMVLDDGAWNLDLFRVWLSEEILLTNLERIRRGLGQSSSCGNCCHEIEDIFHVLRDCVATKDVWKHASQNASKPLSPNPYHKRHIEEMWVHLFSNGAVERDSGKAAAGGVIQNMDSNWILGFSHYLGNCTPFEAELWGILDGFLWRIRHLPREKNLVVDRLAKLCLTWKSSLQTFDKPPDE
ncbi:hypothetical protein Gorai_024561, partial [Gossypium raimondii]|nr:hypothetical protein [Gossypium raimondii]